MIKIDPICSCARIVPAGDFENPNLLLWLLDSSTPSAPTRALAKHKLEQRRAFLLCDQVHGASKESWQSHLCSWLCTRDNPHLMEKCSQIMPSLNYCLLGKKSSVAVLKHEIWSLGYSGWWETEQYDVLVCKEP